VAASVADPTKKRGCSVVVFDQAARRHPSTQQHHLDNATTLADLKTACGNK